MQKIFLLFVIAALYLPSAGQSVKITYNDKKYKITYETIVEDSAGKAYPLEFWTDRFMLGEYRLVPIKPGKKKTHFYLEKISPEEQAVNKTTKPDGGRYFSNGQKVPFEGIDLSGKYFSNKTLLGKVVVLNIWMIDCLPCARGIPHLNELAKDYESDSTIVFIGIAWDKKEQLDSFLQTTSFTYRIIPEGNIALNQTIREVATHLVIDKKGKVRFHSFGYTGQTDYWLRKTIEEVKKG
jgi:thiol-disulfide isomerase/thioredoxin